MRSIVLTLATCLISCILVGCGAEEKKLPEPKPEEKAKLDQQHGAMNDALKAGRDPNQAVAPGGDVAAPTAAGHGR